MMSAMCQNRTPLVSGAIAFDREGLIRSKRDFAYIRHLKLSRFAAILPAATQRRLKSAAPRRTLFGSGPLDRNRAAGHPIAGMADEHLTKVAANRGPRDLGR